MIKIAADRRLLLGYAAAHLLMFITFQDKSIFWYMFSASMLLLISFSLLNEEIDHYAPARNYWFWGIASGLAIYTIFWIGSTLIDILNLPLASQITKLYKQFAPENFWQFAVLIFILAPGEEIFWRGFVQKRLLRSQSLRTATILGAILYASVHFYSGQVSLVLAALVGGLAWGALYAWKRSLPLVIISHIVFDLLLFWFLPLR